MPTYEYRCPDGHEFEQFVQKISLASPELPCPICGKLAARQISAGGGFLFKGSGFYITDYGKDGKKDQRDSAAKAAASKADAAAKSESATADAAAPKDAPATSEPATSVRAVKPRSDAGDRVEKRGAAGAKKAPVAAPSPASTKKNGGAD